MRLEGVREVAPDLASGAEGLRAVISERVATRHAKEGGARAVELSKPAISCPAPPGLWPLLLPTTSLRKATPRTIPPSRSILRLDSRAAQQMAIFQPHLARIADIRPLAPAGSFAATTGSTNQQQGHELTFVSPLCWHRADYLLLVPRRGKVHYPVLRPRNWQPVLRSWHLPSFRHGPRAQEAKCAPGLSA